MAMASDTYCVTTLFALIYLKLSKNICNVLRCIAEYFGNEPTVLSEPLIILSIPHRERAAINISGLLFCGANRDRTGDLLVANQALSQLSYSPDSLPLKITYKGKIAHSLILRVGLSGVEPLTSRLSGVRSNRI
jgi:hypothetical protein